MAGRDARRRRLDGGDLTDEVCSRVIWAADLRAGRGDLEDVGEIEALVGDGWELIDAIVPFAGIAQLDVASPGTTTKLIAYFRRPAGRGTRPC